MAGPDGSLRLNHRQGNAVDQQDEVRSLLGRSHTAGVLAGNHVLVLLDIGKVEQANRDVLTIRSERHRPLPREPSGELLIGLDEPVVTYAHNDGAELVQDVVRTVRLCGNFRIQSNQRLTEVILNEDFVRLARQILRCYVVPAETGYLAVTTGEARINRGMVGDAATEPVADEGFDRIGFVEAHCGSSKAFFMKDCRSARWLACLSLRPSLTLVIAACSLTRRFCSSQHGTGTSA